MTFASLSWDGKIPFVKERLIIWLSGPAIVPIQIFLNLEGKSSGPGATSLRFVTIFVISSVLLGLKKNGDGAFFGYIGCWAYVGSWNFFI